MLWYCLVPGMGLESKSWNHLLHFGILFLVLYPIFHFLSFPSLWSQQWIKSHRPQLSAVLEWSYVYHFTLEAWTVWVYGYSERKLSVWNSIHLSLSECNSLWTISLFLLFSVLVFSLCASCFELCWGVSTWAPALDPTTLKYISCLLPLRDTCHSTYAIVLTIAIHKIPRSAGLGPCPRLYKDLTFDSPCTWRSKKLVLWIWEKDPWKKNI